MSTEIKKFEINNYTFWVGLFISAAVSLLIIIICDYYDHHLTKSESISLFTMFIVLVALYFSSKVFIQTDDKHKEIIALEREKLALDEKIRKENIAIRKKKYSFEITEQWHKAEFAEMVAVSKIFLTDWEASGGKQKSLEEFEKHLDSHPKNRQALIAILNYFEHICVLMDADFIDEQAVKKTFGSLFCIYLTRTETFIKHLQDKQNNKSILCNYLKYSNKWSESR